MAKYIIGTPTHLVFFLSQPLKQLSKLPSTCCLQMDSQGERFVAATEELTETLTEFVESRRQMLGQRPAKSGLPFSAMVLKGMNGMVEPMWNGYYKWMSVLGVTTRKEAEDLLKSFGDEKVMKCIEELGAAEAGFRAFATHLDTTLQTEEDKVQYTRGGGYIRSATCSYM